MAWNIVLLRFTNFFHCISCNGMFGLLQILCWDMQNKLTRFLQIKSLWFSVKNFSRWFIQSRHLYECTSITVGSLFLTVDWFSSTYNVLIKVSAVVVLLIIQLKAHHLTSSVTKSNDYIKYIKFENEINKIWVKLIKVDLTCLWQSQGFPPDGAPTYLLGKILAENCMKMKEIRGGAHV